jgi:hypothetical protein
MHACGPGVIASIRDRSPYLTPMQKRVQRYACQFADRILVNADACATGWSRTKATTRRTSSSSGTAWRCREFTSRTAGISDSPRAGHAAGPRLVVVVSRLARLKGIEHFSKQRAD